MCYYSLAKLCNYVHHFFHCLVPERTLFCFASNYNPILMLRCFYQRSDLFKSLSKYQIGEKELSLYQSASKLGQSFLKENQVGCEVIPGIMPHVISYGKKQRKRMKRIHGVNQSMYCKERKGENIRDVADQLKESDSDDFQSLDESDINVDGHNSSVEREGQRDEVVKEKPCTC